MYTKVVRNGSEIANLVYNKNYDSNHQYINFLSKPVVLNMVKIVLFPTTY